MRWVRHAVSIGEAESKEVRTKYKGLNGKIILKSILEE
jgi:hypothetical protein